MRLWRLTRADRTALDGAGTLKHGGRYSTPGVPVVNLASEAGLAVLVTLRYLQESPADWPDDFVLGWTDVDARPVRAPDAPGVPPLVTRPFSFADCLHTPPMLGHYTAEDDAN